MIYVVESGCRYEGGSAFAASTSHLKAWLELRKHRTPNAKLIAKDYWRDKYDYFCIRVFEDIQ